jgi:ATP-dependent DNA helicase RecQ
LSNQKIHRILEKYWGFKSFRAKQEDIINDILAQKDTLALLPTGGGKSLCYQVPALALEGVCIVISPLVALMKDQVSQLQKRNIKAIAISGGMNHRELDIALDNCIYGDIKLLYLSPERLQSDIVQERIKKMKLSFIAVDEAHCISQWGYDFRPSYLQISEIRKLKPKAPILALTATATREVAKDIQEKLSFKENNLIQKSFKRSNLAYMVLEESHKMDRIQKMLMKIKGSAIIYVRSRKRAYEFSTELNKLGISSLFYHAGLPSTERDANQAKWMDNSVRVIVATNAFGMGIDKPDVRLVIHLQNPDTTEAYFQEAGRAGRDGIKSFAVSLFQRSDLENSIDRFEENYPSAKEVKKIYQHLADYLQIAIGDGFEQAYDFSIDEFCINYKLNLSKCIKALHIIEKESLIKYESFNNTPSSINIICSSKSVINYTSPNKKKVELLQLILRLYPGVFDEPVEIKERSLAIKINQDSSLIYKLLKQLDQEGVIDYKQRTNSGKIIFSSARHSSSHLPISKTHFEERKTLLVGKLQSMNDYLSNTNYCRSKVLLDYFGEKNSDDCGICDVCITNQSNSEEFRKDIQKELLMSLKESPIDISMFVSRYSKIKEDSILYIIKELIAEQIITKEGKTLRINE